MHWNLSIVFPDIHDTVLTPHHPNAPASARPDPRYKDSDRYTQVYSLTCYNTMQRLGLRAKRLVYSLI